jgi:hypothetical protein
MKMAPGGAILWTRFYNGSASSTDVASAVAVDPASGYVYVTGASSAGTFGFMDMVTIAYNQSGTQQWLSSYDYSGAMDIPTAIGFSGAELVVSGSSGASFTNYDFCTILYDKLSGAQNDVERTSNNNSGSQDLVFSMAADSLGSVYVIGKRYNGSNYDVQLQKLDTALTVVWTQTFDAFGADDVGINLDLDDSLNIYVTGYSNTSAGLKKFFLLKYNNAGVLKFAKSPKISGVTQSEGLRVKVKTMDEILVGGNFFYGTNQDIGFLRFDRFGRTTLSKTYNGPANNKDKFMDLTFDDKHIYLSARTYSTATLDRNTVVQYSYKDFPLTPLTNTVTGNRYVDHEVIVSFIKPVLKMAAINNKNITFGKLSDFVHDSTCNKITALLDPENTLKFNAKTTPVRKIFWDMSDQDTLSQSRMGDFVKVPAFYTKLLITLPNNVNTALAAASINTISPDIIGSQHNFLYELFFTPPNDSLYNKQISLHAGTTYTNAHINLKKAWDYSVGQSYIKVGVYDSGIHDYHVDLLGAVTTQSFAFPGLSVPNVDRINHGSAVAGIIGAKSDNIRGVCGIAGGTLTNATGLGSGVSIADMQIMKDSGPGSNTLSTTSDLLYLYKAGADGSNINGAALNISNHSYGATNATYDDAMIEGINYMNANGVAFVAARGNALAAPQNYSLSTFSSPACLRPGLVMNVGASGTDGHYHKKNVNGTQFSSMINNGVDFLAPGDTALVHTVKASYSNIETGISAKTASTIVLNGDYQKFSGTSAAAPHVSGVAALMMSYRNHSVPHWDNLVHEDIEALLKRTATDLVSATYSETTGQDSTSGWGRINADSALSALQPQYKIRHIDKTHYATAVSTTTSMVASNVVRFFTGFPTGLPGVGTYYVNIIEVQTTYSYPFGSETFLASWPLHKASNGYPQSFPGLQGNPYSIISTNSPNFSQIVSSNMNSATIKSYVYYFISTFAPTPQAVNIWAPTSPTNVNTAFTLYSLGDASLGSAEKEIGDELFNVYPNPTSGDLTVAFNPKNEKKGFVTLYDVVGKTVFNSSINNMKSGINLFELKMNRLPQGIYFLSLALENSKVQVKKIIVE